MSVPFTFDEFLEMLERFNTGWWPVHLIMYALAVAAIYLAIRKTRWSARVVTGILVFFWIWVGAVFNLFYFSRLYSMAYLFVVLFILEGIILASAGLFFRGQTHIQGKGRSIRSFERFLLSMHLLVTR